MTYSDGDKMAAAILASAVFKKQSGIDSDTLKKHYEYWLRVVSQPPDPGKIEVKTNIQRG